MTEAETFRSLTLSRSAEEGMLRVSRNEATHLLPRHAYERGLRAPRNFLDSER